MTLSEELTWRGFVKQTTFKDLSALDKEPLTFYWGVDPSSDSMTIGNLAAAMMVKHFINHGHKAILLIGGATGLIGDPDGKARERELLSEQQLAANKQAIVAEFNKILGENTFELVDNIDWFKDLGYLNFLKDIGKHVPMRQMLARDFVSTRLSDSGHGISYAEFSYVLIQAYDFLYLYQNKGVTLQVCGSDQWGNCIAGVDLIRRKTNGEANVFSTPLVVDQATGVKFGKSETGAVWLDPAKTSPTQFYQFWVNTSDDNVESLLKIYTQIDQGQLIELLEKHRANPGERAAQRYLADEVTKIVHGEQAAQLAGQVTNVLTGKQDLTQPLEGSLLDNLRKEIPSIKASVGSEIADALVQSSLATSKTDARQLLESQAVYINGQRVNREKFEDQDFKNGLLLLRRGKAFKDSALVEQA